MDKFAKRFFSMGMMTVGLLLFWIAIGAATFIESIYDTQTAKLYIYNALWFEILLAYLALALIANIAQYRLVANKKWASLLFHVSFIVILLGAWVTRFISYEGVMQLPEGQASNFIFSSEPYIWMRANDGQKQYVYDEQVYFSEWDTWNDFEHTMEFPGHQNPVEIEYVDFEKNQIDSLVINDSIRSTALEFVVNGQSQYIPENGFIMIEEVAVSYEKPNAMPGIELFKQGNKILVKTSLETKGLAMSELRKMDRANPQIADSLYNVLPMDTLVPLEMATLYSAGNAQFVFKSLVRNAKKMRVKAPKKKMGEDYVILKLTDGNQSKTVALKGGVDAIAEKAVFEFNGLQYEMEYGAKRIELPFSVACRDFQLDRYPGSDSPSSFASEVSIIDNERDYTRDQRIFMNNVMDYRGYRFFQSSYFPDESGTILSVNYDWLGTMLTYIGYLLMTLGMIWSIFVKNGRFRELNDKLKKLKERKEGMMTALVILMATSFMSFGQEHVHDEHDGHDHAAHAEDVHIHDEHDGHDHAVHAEEEHSHTQETVTPVFRIMSKEHSSELATLLIQDYSGRIVPLHTMADQLLRKVHRKQSYKDYNAVQTIISMHMYRDHWLNEKIIYVSSKGGLREKLGLNDAYASYMDLINPQTGDFIFAAEYAKAHQMLESKRGEFEKQLIKLNERYQVMNGIFQWYYMKIVPVKSDPNNTWYIPLDEQLLAQDSTSSPMALRYFTALNEGADKNQYGKAVDLLNEFKDFQRSEGAKVAPSETKVNMEVSYTKMNVFGNSWKMYFVFGFILLILFFAQIFKSPKWSRIAVKVSTAILFITFLYHGAGLGMRSYISGHEPWSNGYEAMVFIAWVTMLLGFIFRKKSGMLLAGAAILAFLMIFVSELNLMDPEITPLQPVLKSYWLMIHVAIITGSYAPLGLGAILGLINLILFIVRNKENAKLINLNISELTYLSEMMLTIGVFMLTIGTFLGGVWANESWGRYWGWDPKETWALVAVLVYAIILHLRFIPGMKSKFTFSVASLWGYAAIIFTFFGVNFYLVGLHSYAQGEGLGQIPNSVIIIVVSFVIFTLIAAFRNYQFKREQKN